MHVDWREWNGCKKSGCSPFGPVVVPDPQSESSRLWITEGDALATGAADHDTLFVIIVGGPFGMDCAVRKRRRRGSLILYGERTYQRGRRVGCLDVGG